MIEPAINSSPARMPRGRLFPAVLAAISLLSGLLASCTLPDLFLDQGASTQAPVALFFGINDYPPGFGDLGLCVNDATAMSEYFAAQGWEVYLRTDAACTQASFAALAQTIAAASSQGRRVLFFYAGHGYGYPGTTGKEQSYMVWWASLSATVDWISPEILQGLLQPLLDKKLKVSLVLDSCNSGGFVFDAAWVDTLPWDYSDTTSWGEGSLMSPDLRAFLEWFGSSSQADSDTASTQTFDPDLVWSMSAAGYGENSHEASSYKDKEGRGHGIFTWSFLKGLEADQDSYLEADRNRDGFTSFREVYDFARNLVKTTWDARGQAYDLQDFLPHISGNYTDIMLFTR